MHNDLCCRKANYCQLVHGIGSACGLILNKREQNEVRNKTSVAVTSVTVLLIRNLKHANKTCTSVCVRDLCTNMKSKSTKTTRTRWSPSWRQPLPSLPVSSGPQSRINYGWTLSTSFASLKSHLHAERANACFSSMKTLLQWLKTVITGGVLPRRRLMFCNFRYRL